MPKVYRRHEFDLTINALPPLPFLAGGEKFFPSYRRFNCHSSIFCCCDFSHGRLENTKTARRT